MSQRSSVSGSARVALFDEETPISVTFTMPEARAGQLSSRTAVVRCDTDESGVLRAIANAFACHMMVDDADAVLFPFVLDLIWAHALVDPAPGWVAVVDGEGLGQDVIRRACWFAGASDVLSSEEIGDAANTEEGREVVYLAAPYSGCNLNDLLGSASVNSNVVLMGWNEVEPVDVYQGIHRRSLRLFSLGDIPPPRIIDDSWSLLRANKTWLAQTVQDHVRDVDTSLVLSDSAKFLEGCWGQ